MFPGEAPHNDENIISIVVGIDALLPRLRSILDTETICCRPGMEKPFVVTIIIITIILIIITISTSIP